MSLFLADFAQADAIQKINVIGAAWQATTMDPYSGAAPHQAVVLLVDTSPQYIGETFALELALLDQDGRVVSLPGPAGDDQAMRVQQMVTAQRPVLPGSSVPGWSHNQWVLSIAALPLTPNRLYTWRALIDGDMDHAWNVSFYVAGVQGPFIG